MDKNTLHIYAQKRINELKHNIMLESDNRYKDLYFADYNRWKRILDELKQESLKCMN